MKEDRYSLLNRALKEFKKPRVIRGFNSDKPGLKSPRRGAAQENSVFNNNAMESLSEKERNIFVRNQQLHKSRNFPKFNEINTYIDEFSLLFDSNFESGNLRRVYKVIYQ